MSNVSNRHAITRFVAGESKPLATQRLAKIGYKPRGKTPAKFKSVCASLPMIQAEEVTPHITALLPFIGNMLETAQDGIIRSLYESSGGILSDISDEQLSVPACIAYLSAKAAGDRLSEESITAWFSAECADNLAVVIAEKAGFDLSTPEQMETVNAKVDIHKKILTMIAGKNVILTEQQKTVIRNCIKFGANTDSGIGLKISDKFDALCAAPVDQLQDIEAY